MILRVVARVPYRVDTTGWRVAVAEAVAAAVGDRWFGGRLVCDCGLRTSTRRRRGRGTREREGRRGVRLSIGVAQARQTPEQSVVGNAAAADIVRVGKMQSSADIYSMYVWLN